MKNEAEILSCPVPPLPGSQKVWKYYGVRLRLLCHVARTDVTTAHLCRWRIESDLFFRHCLLHSNRKSITVRMAKHSESHWNTQAAENGRIGQLETSAHLHHDKRCTYAHERAQAQGCSCTMHGCESAAEAPAAPSSQPTLYSWLAGPAASNHQCTR
jgi:hypothetical protein